MKTRDVDLSAQFLGLEKTLEDDILDIMEGLVKENATNVIEEVIQDIKTDSDLHNLDNHIRNIVYDVLKEVLGTSLITRGGSGKSFKQQLFFELEKNGFVRDCPTCYFNTQKLGKIKHNDR